MQRRHYESELDIFKMRPTQDSQRFTDLLTFMSHVAPCFKDECPKFSAQMMDLMENNAGTLHPDVRSKLLQALMLLRNREMLNPLHMLQLCFKLFAVQDKTLRIILSEYIITDIKNLNLHKTNDKLNRRVQALLFGIVSEDTTVAARKSVYIMSELYRRKVWVDPRTVNVIASACSSESTRVMVAGLKFFLGIETRMHDDEEEEEEKIGAAAKSMEINYHQHSKKTRARARSVKKQQEQVAKLRREKDKSDEPTPLYPAILLIHDPNALAEKLFKRVRQSCERFEVKLLLMNMISRLVGCHQLLLLNFYSFLQRYLTSHQQSVTVILTYLIQACHPLVPPEELTPVIRAIAFNFITERCNNEVISVGINAVREIMQRVPAILREPGMDDFMGDLVQYGRKTHKSVMIAAHSLINLVRELYPTLLHKSHRGKNYNPNAFPAKYGQNDVSDGVEGVELLEAYEKGDIEIDEDGDVLWKSDRIERSDDDESDDDDDGSEPPELVEVDDDDSFEECSEDNGEEDDGENNGEEGDGEIGDVADEGEEWEECSDDEEGEGNENEWENCDEGDEGNEGAEGETNTEGDEWESCSEDESGDEEGDGENDETPSQPSVPPSLNNRLDRQRILTSEDFALLEKLKSAQRERQNDPRNRTKRKRDDDDDEEERVSVPYTVSEDQIAPEAKVKKATKMERLVRVLEGRTESRFEHEGHAGGLTNKEKLRKKNFVMVRKGKREVARKSQQSNSEVRYLKGKRKEIYGRDRRKRRRT